MKFCFIGMHKWSLWSMPKECHNNFIQHRVCKHCGKQTYREVYNNQVNVEEDFYKSAVSDTEQLQDKE